MSIERIDKETCIGCQKCVEACIMDVIRFDKQAHKAVIKYPKECYCCYSCEVSCPTHAIYVDPRKLRSITPAWS